MTSQRPTVVYVAGHGRSGSTLLGMLLGARPGAFVAGELALLFDRWLHGDQVCSCGNLLQACPVWSAVLEGYRARRPGSSLAKAGRLTDKMERLATGWMAGLWSPRNRAEYGRVWADVLASIFEVTGSGTLVDISKSAHPRARRAHLLAKEAGADVRLLIVTRDPREVMRSVATAGSRKGKRKVFSDARTLISWNTTYAYASLVHDAGAIPTRRSGMRS